MTAAYTFGTSDAAADEVGGYAAGLSWLLHFFFPSQLSIGADGSVTFRGYRRAPAAELCGNLTRLTQQYTEIAATVAPSEIAICDAQQNGARFIESKLLGLVSALFTASCRRLLERRSLSSRLGNAPAGGSTLPAAKGCRWRQRFSRLMHQVV